MKFMLQSFHFTHEKMRTAQCEVHETGKQLHLLHVGIRKVLNLFVIYKNPLTLTGLKRTADQSV